MPRSTKLFRKRVGRGNKTKSDSESGMPSLNEVKPDLSAPSTSRPTSRPSTPGSSSSSRKLGKSLEVSAEKLKEFGAEEEKPIIDSGNIIINMTILTEALCLFTACKFCEQINTLYVQEDTKKRVGVVSTLLICCSACKSKNTFQSSNKTESGLYENNLRLVYALRTIGKGAHAGKKFCAVMDLPKPPAKFTKYVEKVTSAVNTVSEDSMKNAVEETVLLNDNCRDLVAALDGTFHKRGHTSKNGVVTATSIETGKVIDVAILTKYCHKCGTKTKPKDHVCVANYEGSSGGMEVAGAVEIFGRSETTRNVRYVQYLGDGDSKGFMKVVESEPYGDSVTIEKLECVGHVQKRLGSRLRKLRKDYKGKKLSDGKLLSGKGRLTDAEIDNLQSYYGKAIRSNTDSLSNMKQAVWATWFHKLSTDKSPQHNLCPKGEESWCKFNKSLVTGEEFSHKHSLPSAVLDLIKPIYKDLAKPDLLKKCLHGRTQNPNESVNAVIWTRIPKTVFVGYKTLKLGVLDAVIDFNDGNIGKVKVFEELGIEPGYNMLNTLRELDVERVRQSDAAHAILEKQARQRRRNAKRKLEDSMEDEDDPEYGPGIA